MRQRYLSYNIFSTLSRTFFNLLYLVSRPSNKLNFSGINHNGERGIWTLAPRERPTPLAGAPLQPLEYFSIQQISAEQDLVYQLCSILSIIFFIFLIFFYFSGILSIFFRITITISWGQNTFWPQHLIIYLCHTCYFPDCLLQLL